MLTSEHAQQIMLGVLMNWFSEEEKLAWWGKVDELLERRGPGHIDAREIVVKKLLEVPDRGREMVLSFIDEGATPQEFTEIVTGLFRWIDAHASGVKAGDVDAAITRICSGLDLEWRRAPGGYLIRLAFGGLSRSRTSVLH